MKRLIANRDGTFCPRRIGFYLFGLTSIIGFFLGLNEYLVGMFLAASIGKSWLLNTQK